MTAKIHITIQEDEAVIEGTFAPGPSLRGKLRYVMTVKREGGDSLSQSSHSNYFKSRVGGAQSLSKTRLSVSTGDRLLIDLKVFKDEELIAKDTLEKTIYATD